MAKAFSPTRHNGVEPVQIREALFGGFAHSRVLKLHGKRMINKDFTPRAKYSIQRKDMAEALTLAKSVNLTLPSLTANMELWDHMMNNDMAYLDHSASIFFQLILFSINKSPQGLHLESSYNKLSRFTNLVVHSTTHSWGTCSH